MEKFRNIKDLDQEDWYTNNFVKGVLIEMNEMNVRHYSLKEAGSLDSECYTINVLYFECGELVTDEDYCEAQDEIDSIVEIAKGFEDEGNPPGVIIPYFGDVWMVTTRYK